MTEQDFPEFDDDVMLMSGSMATTEDLAKFQHLEHIIVYDKPYRVFALPNGDKLKIYPKSEGQIGRIDEAFQEWFDAIQKIERKVNKRWRLWRRRRRQVKEELTGAQAAKFKLFQHIFEDLYVAQRHQDLSAEQFMQMPLDLQNAILKAFRESNDVSGLMREMLGPEIYDAKKKAILQAIVLAGMPISSK